MGALKVLITDYAWPTVEIERGILGAIGAELIVAETGAEDELVRLAPDADAILTCWQRTTAAVLEAAPRCRYVGRYGIGLDNIAVGRATELGILVTNVPDFCFDEVAEHALALLLACSRKIVPFARDTDRGIWNLAAGRPIARLRGQTLGLIGYGGIARALAARARGLGLNIIAYTPRLAPGPLDNGVTGTNDLGALLAAADYVSIHAPATDETRSMFNAATLRQMKPTAYLINTSRGALIDEGDLYHALTAGWIAGAALDVLTKEPAEPNHPLLTLPNTIVTPHAAFYSEESTEELQRKTATQAALALTGQTPPNIVNPAVRGQENYRAGV